MFHKRGCPRCQGDVYEESDPYSPAIHELVCLQCGWRQERRVEVVHLPINTTPPDPDPKVIYARQQADTIGYLLMQAKEKVDQVAETLGISRRTVFRGVVRHRRQMAGG